MPPKAQSKRSRRQSQPQNRKAQAQEISLRLENRLLGKLDARISKARLGPFQVQGMGPSSTGVMASSFKTAAVPGFKDALRVSGQERLGDIVTTGPVTSGAVLYAALINPTSFGVRLAAYGHLYNKFCFRKLNVIWVPRMSIANQSAAGEIMFANDPDPTDVSVVGTTVNDINEMFSWEGSQTTSIYNPNTFVVRRLDPKNVYYMHNNSGDLRLSTQGQVYVVAATELPNDDNYGTLYLQYEVDLFVPQATTSISTLQNGFISKNTSGFDWGAPFGDTDNISSLLQNGIEMYRDDNGDTILEFPVGGSYMVILYAALANQANAVTLANANAYWAVNIISPGVTVIPMFTNGLVKPDTVNNTEDLVGWGSVFIINTTNAGLSRAKLGIFMYSAMTNPTVNVVSCYVFQAFQNMVSSTGFDVRPRNKPMPLMQRVAQPVEPSSSRSSAYHVVGSSVEDVSSLRSTPARAPAPTLHGTFLRRGALHM